MQKAALRLKIEIKSLFHNTGIYVNLIARRGFSNNILVLAENLFVKIRFSSNIFLKLKICTLIKITVLTNMYLVHRVLKHFIEAS